MSQWSVNGKTPSRDVRADRIAAGTVGGDHVTPASLNGGSLTTTISPFDNRITYGGSWSIAAGGGVFEQYLSQYAHSGTAGSSLTFTFTGTSIALMGETNTQGGYADVYIDGALQGGKVTTYTYMAASYFLTNGLPLTATSVTVSDTSDFNSSGSILIDNEVMTYTSKTATTFDGLARTNPQPHNAASMVYAYSSRINYYSPFGQVRSLNWSNSLLSPGQHTLRLVVRSDSDPLSDAGGSVGQTYVHSIILGGLVGASSIHTYIDDITVSNVAFDASGISTTVYYPTSKSTSQQIMAVTSAVARDGTATFYPCFFSRQTGGGGYKFYAPTSASTTKDVHLTVLVLGSGI